MTTDSLRLDRSRLLRSGLGLRPLAVAVLMTLYVASSAWAQGAPAHSQGPGLGTQVIGWTDVRLGATGGAGAGTYVWQLVVGAGYDRNSAK